MIMTTCIYNIIIITPVDVVVRVLWRVVLQYPVHLRNVQASGPHVRTQQRAARCREELRIVIRFYYYSNLGT